MPATKTVSKRKTTHGAKRHAKHHRVGKDYLKVYWPYVPMLLIVALGLFIGTPRANHKAGVLAYATEISSNRLLTETNERRVANHSQPLVMNEALSTAAQTKANDMAMHNYWSHYTPSGEAPWVFIDKSGYAYSKAGENLAYGFGTSDETVNGWMNSPTHKANMLDNSFSEVGFGFANSADFNKSGHETIVVAMYGRPNKQQTTVAASNPSHTNGAFTTTSNAAEPASRPVSLIQKITGGSAPWITFAVGLMSGFMLLFVFIRHGLAFKRVLIHGEQFLVKHPVLDIIFVGFVMTGYVLSQTSGFIR
jgi:uncharacterized protein YkwD